MQAVADKEVEEARQKLELLKGDFASGRDAAMGADNNDAKGEEEVKQLRAALAKAEAERDEARKSGAMPLQPEDAGQTAPPAHPSAEDMESLEKELAEAEEDYAAAVKEGRSEARAPASLRRLADLTERVEAGKRRRTG